MKILFACHRLPYPPKRGGKIRPFNIVRHLTSQGHCVTVATLSRSSEELEEGQGLREYCDKLLVGEIGKVSATVQMVGRLPSTSPSSMGYFYSRPLHRQVAAELETGGYDMVFVHCSSAAQYVRARPDIPSILDFGDMDSQKWLDYSKFRPFPLSLGYWLEGSKLHRQEKRLAANFTMSTCTTRAELNSLRELGTAGKTGWFPNGVDADFFCPDEGEYDQDQICFIGRMDYYPNQQGMTWFCSEILPAIQARRPETKLVIVGAAPPPNIRRLGELPGVTVTGTVPDVRPYVRRSVLTVAPLMIARGTQNKILESMAMGVPVLSSTTAAGGVDAVSEEHILTADDRDRYVHQALRVLENPGFRTDLSRAARDRVLTRHNWANSMRMLDELVSSL
jgi:sugar transferase (PEP-CTERM/EpsH1 system associated)